MITNNMVTEHAIGATTIKPDNKMMANSRNIQQSQYNNTEQYFELESDESIWVITTKKNINMNEQYHTTYRKNNNLEKCAGMGLNGFHIKLLIGTHCN